MRKFAWILSIGLMIILLRASHLRSAAADVGLPLPALQQKQSNANIIYAEWTDPKRENRVVPVKIYLPNERSKPQPVIVFSHGLGGNREAATFLGQYWSEHGYVSVHVQHIGSDTSIWQTSISEGPKAILTNMRSGITLKTFEDRNKDISFVLDQLEKLNKSDTRFKGQLDLTRIAMAGHSFGAGTTLAIAGQSYARGNYRDPRVKAAIYLSPPVNLHGRNPSDVFGSITIPGLLMTGTEDASPIGETRKEDRRIPFDAITAKAQYLVTFIGGDHMIFNGRILPQNAKPTDRIFSKQIQEVTTTFLDAYLRGNAAKQQWLKKSAPEYFAKTAYYEQK